MIKVSRILLAVSAYQEAIREYYKKHGMEAVLDDKKKEFAIPEKLTSKEEVSNMEKWRKMLADV